jgi:hypothetical protein
MIVQYWIGIPNRVNSLAKNSTNSSISQSYITLLITAIPWHSSLKDEGRLSWRPLSFQAERAMSLLAHSVISLRRKIWSLLGGIADIPTARWMSRDPSFSLWTTIERCLTMAASRSLLNRPLPSEAEIFLSVALFKPLSDQGPPRSTVAD